MQIDQIEGPGIDVWRVGQLKSWGYVSLTEIQERAFTAGVADGQSMIVCAPTSSGKTLVGEVGVVTGLRRGCKGVYLVPDRKPQPQAQPPHSGAGCTGFC